MAAPRPPLTILQLIVIIVWLVIGPFLCSLLWLFIFSHFFMPVNGKVYVHGTIYTLADTTLPGALAGIPLFFLPYPLWQRIFAFVLYAPIAGAFVILVAGAPL